MGRKKGEERSVRHRDTPFSPARRHPLPIRTHPSSSEPKRDKPEPRAPALHAELYSRPVADVPRSRCTLQEADCCLQRHRANGAANLTRPRAAREGRQPSQPARLPPRIRHTWGDRLRGRSPRAFHADIESSDSPLNVGMEKVTRGARAIASGRRAISRVPSLRPLERQILS